MMLVFKAQHMLRRTVKYQKNESFNQEGNNNDGKSSVVAKNLHFVTYNTLLHAHLRLAGRSNSLHILSKLVYTSTEEFVFSVGKCFSISLANTALNYHSSIFQFQVYDRVRT